VILLITYRSPVLWLLPVISAGVALITGKPDPARDDLRQDRVTAMTPG
jgi:hypothetical protein